MCLDSKWLLLVEVTVLGCVWDSRIIIKTIPLLQGKNCVYCTFIINQVQFSNLNICEHNQGSMF